MCECECRRGVSSLDATTEPATTVENLAKAVKYHARLVEALADLTAACERVAEDLEERDVVMWADVSGNAAAAFELLLEIAADDR